MQNRSINLCTIKINKMKKVAIKVKDRKHGKKVVEYLESIGGDNYYECIGSNTGEYYHINKNGLIDAACDIPDGYIEIQLPEEKTFPREMWVWDDRLPKEKHIVYGIIPNMKYGVITTTYCEYVVGYQHCEEIIEEPTTEETHAVKKIKKILNKYNLSIGDVVELIK